MSEPKILTNTVLKEIMTDTLSSREIMRSSEEDMHQIVTAGVYSVDITSGCMMNSPVPDTSSMRGLVIVGVVKSSIIVQIYFSHTTPRYMAWNIRWYTNWTPWQIIYST